MIEGGHALSGRVRASGNKNGALPILAACLLTDEEVRLSNVPRIRDVETMLGLLGAIGADAEWIGANEVRVQARDIGHEVDEALASQIRASFLLAGPLLARHGRAVVPPPGGDVIGRRRLDPHIHAFGELGAVARVQRPLRAERDTRRRAHPSRRSVGDGDGERRDGGEHHAGADDDLERSQRTARTGPVPLLDLARCGHRRRRLERPARERGRGTARRELLGRARARRGRQPDRHGRRDRRRHHRRGNRARRPVADPAGPPALRGRGGARRRLGPRAARTSVSRSSTISAVRSRRSRTVPGRHFRPTSRRSR